MDASRAVPQLSAAEAEEFYASGTEAYPARNQETYSVLIDAPGVRNLRIVEAPVVEPGRPHVAGEVPPPLKSQLREELLSQLIFASRDLAEHTVAKFRVEMNGAPCGPVGVCRECEAMVYGLGAGGHKSNCRARRVLLLIEELVSTVEPGAGKPEPTLIRKESAPDEANPLAAPAGDGIRLFGDFGEPWRYVVFEALNRTCVYDRDGVLLYSVNEAAPSVENWAREFTRLMNSATTHKAVAQ